MDDFKFDEDGYIITENHITINLLVLWLKLLKIIGMIIISNTKTL